ncbi:MAG TPA: phosphodiester glycosidase family protein [Luteolibacter sp.]
MWKALGAWMLGVIGGFAGEVREEIVDHAGSTFRVVRLEPARVQLVWKGEDGLPLRSFSRVQAHFARQGKTVRFLMNGGIFEPGGIPSGLYVERSNKLQPFNFREAAGNFFLKPNGLVGWTGDRAFVATSLKGPVGWAVQSGPMLLISGKRHPAFTAGSASRLHRNGVGVDGSGRLVFAITAAGQMVNFWDFAGLFEKLGCRDALFLDGDISQMAVNPSKPVDSNSFGSMFVVAE